MIQIIDGFNLQTSTPIDSRIVVADDAEKALITSTYPGLRIWQVDTNTPYFWDTLTNPSMPAWKSELDLVVTGNGTNDFIPKFISSDPTKIGDSQILDDGSLVTISNDLKVIGDVTANSFSGSLDSSNLIGTIGLDKIDNSGSEGNILQLVDNGVTLEPTWNDISTVSIGTSTLALQVDLKVATTTNYYSFIVRDENDSLSSSSTTNMDLYTYDGNDLIISEDSTSMCILAHEGSKENPPYSFHTSTTVLGGIYYDNSISISYNENQIGKFDNLGFKTIDGSESDPSISFIGDVDTGIYRPSDNVISFSTNGNETVRMDTNGFKTILGSKTNPSISSFGTKTFGVPGGGMSTSNFEDTGFYFNSNYYGASTGIVKQLNFVTDGDDILSFNNHGINIFTVGTNQLPSISFTSIGSQPSGINGGEHYVSLVTGQIERFRVEGGSAFNQNTGYMYLHGNVNVEDNLYLLQPNSSSPSAGKVLTSVDSTGKVEWSNSAVALHAPDYTNLTGPGISNTWNGTTSLIKDDIKNDGKKYIIHVISKVDVSPKWEGPNKSTAVLRATLKFNGSDVDNSNFRDQNENNGDEIQTYQQTLVCTYTQEITANGQEIELTGKLIEGDGGVNYQKNWTGPKISILYVPVL